MLQNDYPRFLLGVAVTEIAAAVARHNEEDDLATAIRATFAVGTTLYIPTYTRRDEREADRIGLF